jgi:hypothetical protein
MSNNFKIIKNAGSLSEDDLGLIAGTPFILNMMRNRIVVVFEDPQNIDWEKLTDHMEGLYHIRKLDERKNNIFQIWFEFPEDLNKFEKNAMLNKLGVTS